MKYKKTAFLFSIISLSFLMFFQKDDLKKIFQPSNSLRKNITSSCRAFPQKFYSNSNLNRMQKLNRLMDTAIDWVFTDLNGEVIDLYCLKDKKIIILNFWATWCPPCIKELNSLAQLAWENRDKIFVVAISTEDESAVRDFLIHSFSDLNPVLAVAVVSDEEKLKYFPKDSLPTTYIFDTKGLLQMKELGERDWSNKNIVQSILKLD